MIHIDIEKEEMEYDCSGERMVEEIAAVLAYSMYDMEKTGGFEGMPGKLEDHVDAIFDEIGEAIVGLTKVLYWGLKKEGEKYEEAEADTERSREAIHTDIKRFRRKGIPS